MDILTQIKRIAFKRRLILRKVKPTSPIREFIYRFRDKYVSVDLLRIGGEHDGGYLLPDVLKDIEYCFSPGVDYTSNFESEISRKYGIKSFMADASVDAPPILDENFEFIRKFIGTRIDDSYITLSDWYSQSTAHSQSGIILQMDIEGGEYDVLTFESAEFLANFSVMVIEFHDLNNIFEPFFLTILSSIFEKIYKYFSICHIHPNNCCDITSLDGIDVPRIVEITFIRNDLATELKNNNKINLPHALDRKNVVDCEELVMPEIWWKT